MEKTTTDDEEDEVGIAIPATMGMLGLAFIGCALVIAGLPPLSGFIAKFALLTAALNPSGLRRGGAIPAGSWALLVVLLLSGLAALIAMTRAGIRAFWASPDRTVPRVRMIEMAPIVVLLILCAAQTVQAGPVMRFMQATAQSLHAPGGLRPRRAAPANNTRERRAGYDAAPAVSARERSACWACGCCSIKRSPWARSFSAACSRLPAGGHWRRCSFRKRAFGGSASILRLLALVLADIIRSNIAVGRIILGLGRSTAEVRLREHPSRSSQSLCSGRAGLHHHGDPRNPVGQLRCTGGLLTIHVLDLIDESEWVRTIKSRYERHLLEIFE